VATDHRCAPDAASSAVSWGAFVASVRTKITRPSATTTFDVTVPSRTFQRTASGGRSGLSVSSPSCCGFVIHAVLASAARDGGGRTARHSSTTRRTRTRMLVRDLPDLRRSKAASM
jgi:hypothetical protein